MQENIPKVDPPWSEREQVVASLLKRWMKLGWESNDNELVDEHFHPDCIISGLAPEVVEGIDELRAVHRAICGRMTHRQANILSLLIRGDQFAATMEFEGLHHETEIDVAFEVACHGTMKGGLIFRAHNIIDYTGLYAKLGILDFNKITEFFA